MNEDSSSFCPTSEVAPQVAGESESLAELIQDAKRGLTAVPDVTATDDERRFIAWARYYHGSVTGLVVKYDELDDQLRAAQAVVKAARVLVKVHEDPMVCSPGPLYAELLDALASAVREMGEQR